MRIDNLSYSNMQTQGAQRRALLRQQSPQHLEYCSSLILRAIRERHPGVSPNALILGSGACTEIPLTELVRSSDEVVLADLDLASMQRGASELPASALRKRVLLAQLRAEGFHVAPATLAEVLRLAGE